MGVHEFFLEPARRAVKKAIADVEAQTSVEVVVTVRRSCGYYRSADLGAGAFFALVLLCVFLYHPEPFDFTYLPLELAIAFGIGALLSAYVAPLRRALTPPKVRAANVARAAKAAFVDLGVGRTKARTGVLVFVAAFEKRVEIVADVGVHPKVLGPAWDEAKRKLDRAFRLDGSVERFVMALRELGPVLANEHPRAHDDENELADDLAEHDDLEGSDDAVVDEGAHA